MKFVFDDGGRAAADYKGTTGDCVTRAVAIATGLPYQEVYDAVNALATGERTGKRTRGKSNARTGVRKPSIRKLNLTRSRCWVACHRSAFPGLRPRYGRRRWRSGNRDRRPNER